MQLAEQKGYDVPRDIRAELDRAKLDESRWKEIVELLRESLHYRQGRYYVIRAEGSPRLEREHQLQQRVRDVLQKVLESPATDAPSERRQEERTPYTRPITIQTEDRQEFTVLSQDLSASGIRFIANRTFLGKKLSVLLRGVDETAPAVTLVVRILWATQVSEGLFENGGAFLDLLSEPTSRSGRVPPASR